MAMIFEGCHLFQLYIMVYMNDDAKKGIKNYEEDVIGLDISFFFFFTFSFW